MKRCSRCRTPHERDGQRYCLSCQATYMRERRAQEKPHKPIERPKMTASVVCDIASPSRRETPLPKEGT